MTALDGLFSLVEAGSSLFVYILQGVSFPPRTVLLVEYLL